MFFHPLTLFGASPQSSKKSSVERTKFKRLFLGTTKKLHFKDSDFVKKKNSLSHLQVLLNNTLSTLPIRKIKLRKFNDWVTFWSFL
jgi:hypothetical protein